MKKNGHNIENNETINNITNNPKIIEFTINNPLSVAGSSHEGSS